MASKGKRPGTAKGKKGPTAGSGGQRRKSLEGKGPTPKAEDRKGHKAFRGNKPEKQVARKGEFLAPTARTAGVAGARRTNTKGVSKAADSGEVLSGRNSVLEALRAKVPATALYISNRIEMDERVKETITLANARQIPINDITKPEIDRLTGFDAVHQGIALSVPAYSYQHPVDLLDKVISRGQKPLFVALDGITDPRNLGAIIRSVAAFGGHGVILPQRRSTGVTASAWKTSAGAAARIPVALAANLTATIKEYKKKGGGYK